MYTAGAFCVPLGGMVWGPLMDVKGAKWTGAVGMCVFSAGCLLFAFADSKTFDAYVPAACLVSIGGMAIFLSHFVLAEYFADDHFGLVHSLINCSFDASTVTFTMLELIHGEGASAPVAVPGHGGARVGVPRAHERDGVGRAPVTAREEAY